MEDIMTGTVRLTVSEILDRKNMSTAEFAERTGFTYNTALAIRRGSISRINLETISIICDVLDVDPGDIIVKDRE